MSLRQKVPQLSRELQQEWDKKLAESGFEDIERQIGSERVLKQSAAYSFRRSEHTADVRDAKAAYFSLLSEWVQKEKDFKDDPQSPPLSLFEGTHKCRFSSERFIMEKTAEGWTIQQISRELKALGLNKNNRDTIRYIRRRYEDKWGIKSWKPQDMVSRRVAPTPSCPSPQTQFLFNTKISSSRNGKGR